jgi:uncharacterized membrane protein
MNNILDTFSLKHLLLYIALILAVDIPFLRFIFGEPYGKMVQAIQGTPMQIVEGGWTKMVGVGGVYVLMALAILMYVRPRIEDNVSAMAWGGLLGSIIYGVYAFTAYALFSNWDLNLALVDLVWGGVLFALVSVLGYQIEGMGWL